MSPLFCLWILLLAWFVGSAFYIHFRGRDRLFFRRQVTDHSTFLAPYNCLVYLFSGVPNEPILEVDDFPDLRRLRDNWQTIRDEAVALHQGGHIRASERHDDLGFNTFFRKGWKRFYLEWYGEPLASARELCPKTVELVRSIPTIHGAMFAAMAPRSQVGKHRDPFAGSLRYHLGLVTPNSDACRISIDGNWYSWRDGEDLVFDETYVHHFENHTDVTRIILFCDFERPIANRWMRGLNRWVMKHVLPLTATQNKDGERVGLANRVFATIYPWRQPLRTFKKRNRRLYYVFKYAAMAGVAVLLVAGGYRVLR